MPFAQILCECCRVNSADYRSQRFSIAICHECLRQVQMGLVDMLGETFITDATAGHGPQLILEFGFSSASQPELGLFNLNYNTATSFRVVAGEGNESESSAA